MRISKKWRRMQPIYRLFGGEGLDYSEEAALEMYLFESRGIGNLRLGLFGSRNGYANGKHWLNVTVAMWLEDIVNGLLFIDELYDAYAPEYHWWLDSILKKDIHVAQWRAICNQWMPVHKYHKEFTYVKTT